LAIARAAQAMGARPRGTSTSIGSGPGKPRSAHSRRPPGPGPPARSGWATGSISTCLSRWPATRPVRCDRPTHPGTPNAVPGPGSGQPGLTCPGLLRRTSGIYGYVRAGPGTVAGSAEDGSRTGASACTPASSALQLRRPGRGAADARLLHDQPSDRSRPGPSIERRLRACGLGRFCGGSLQTFARSAATGSMARALVGFAGRGAHHRHFPVCWPANWGRPGGAGQPAPARRTSPH